MIILIIFAFLAGLVTILSPCILPILPIILGSATPGASKAKPLGIVTGFVASFTFFTLFLSTIVRLTGLPAESLRIASVVIIAGFGISLLIPKFQTMLEVLFSRLSGFVPRSNTQNQGFFAGTLVGFSLGLLWTPCVGPILASVISLAITGTVTGTALLITLSYAAGTAIPMFAIIYSGGKLLQNHPSLLRNTANIQKAFGVLMIATAIAIFFNFDRKFQAYILDIFPNYGVGLTKLEDNSLIKNQLNQLAGDPKEVNMGKTTDQIIGNAYPTAPEIIPGGEWLNTTPLTLTTLRGRVVLIDFWTYTCINCIRTMPYLRSWHQKYKDQGLTIIGVHSPEFEFEKNINNLKTAVTDFGLTYPIVQDNNFATWRSYKNQYWPAKYLIDKDGKIRYTHFGEGEYDQTEQKIQELLEETGVTTSDITISNSRYDIFAKTPELYLGYKRIRSLASPEKILTDQIQKYTNPQNLIQNYFAFSGKWLISGEYSQPSIGSKLTLNFSSKEVYLVMESESETEILLRLDGKLLTAANDGDDVQNSKITITKNRLYHIINLQEPGQYTLEIEFLDQDTRIFALTFG